MVFESLLNSILQSAAGDFITGIDTDNLKVGVFSGKVEIKKVQLNHSSLEKKLRLPLKIKFSSIGKLKLDVPWTSLSSSPVQAVLENVFVIIEAVDPKKWKKFNVFDLKKVDVEAYAN